MIQLPNNCRCSDLNVHPKNWKTAKASLKISWYITYRFYDPLSEKFKNGKLIQIKGMNKLKDLASRQQLTEEAMNYELDLLLNHGYNPITGQMITSTEKEYEISPQTPFIKALLKAWERIEYEPETRRDVKSILKYFEKSALQLRFTQIPIYDIKKKHVRMTLDNCQNLTTETKTGKIVPKKWTANQFNHYRKYLSSLFAELCELEAIESNPIRDIAKKQTTKNIRRTLVPEERKKVDDFIKTNYYTFWRFIQIFFHSGSRTTELLRIKFEDVDLSTQHFKITIKKGKQRREVLKTIKDIALPLWIEIMQSCKPGQYVFGKGLVPNVTSTCSHQISRRWNEHVKKKLNLDADFYSLKHLNTSETVDILNDEDAAKMNGHTSTAMVVGIYDIRRNDRQHERLKKVNNSFV